MTARPRVGHAAAAVVAYVELERVGGVVLWSGQARAYADGRWHDMDTYDCVFAPCGVKHGISMSDKTVLWGGFAAPPQLDLYRRTDWYEDGVFAAPPFEMLDVPAEVLPSGA